jgi:putative hemolysin
MLRVTHHPDEDAMSALALEIAIILLLLLINGVFAMSELAVLSAKRVRLEHRADRGDAGARVALELAREPTQFLSTVQVGITLVGVLAGAFGGARLSVPLAEALRRVPWLAAHSEGAALAIVVAAITYFTLIIGELVPKRLALGNPERVASLVARPMSAVARAARPLATVLSGSTRLVLRLFGVKDVPEPGLTEEEIHTLVEQGAQSGVVPEKEHEIVESVFRLGDREVGSVMTARPDIEWIDLESSADEVRARLAEQRRPWFLVCERQVESVRGIVHAGDLLATLLAGRPLDLRAAMGEPLFVPEAMPVLRLLETLRRSRQHVAIVLDEYGGVAGLVTLDHIVDQLVGGDEATDGEPAPLTRTQLGWLATGSAAIEEVADALGLERMRDNDADSPRGYRTLAGFILARLGRVPVTGDVVEYEGLRFEVVAMDGRRIEQVRIADARSGERPGPLPQRG